MAMSPFSRGDQVQTWLPARFNRGAALLLPCFVRCEMVPKHVGRHVFHDEIVPAQSEGCLHAQRQRIGRPPDNRHALASLALNAANRMLPRTHREEGRGITFWPSKDRIPAFERRAPSPWRVLPSHVLTWVDDVIQRRYPAVRIWLVPHGRHNEQVPSAGSRYVGNSFAFCPFASELVVCMIVHVLRRPPADSKRTNVSQ